MALDDNTNISFGFTNYAFGYGNSNQYNVYTLANGEQPAQRSITLNPSDGVGGNNIITPLRIFSKGIIYGVLNGTNGSSLVQNFPNFNGGNFIPLPPPPPYNASIDYVVSNSLGLHNVNIAIPYISAVASDGSLAESFIYEMVSTFNVPEYTNQNTTTHLGVLVWDLANVISHFNTAQAFVNNTFNGSGIQYDINTSATYSGTSINWGEKFNPIAINTNGWAVGCGLTAVDYYDYYDTNYQDGFYWLNYPINSIMSEYEYYSENNYDTEFIWGTWNEYSIPVYFGSQIWDGQFFHNLNGAPGSFDWASTSTNKGTGPVITNNDIAINLNNQNQVIVQGYDTNGMYFTNNYPNGTQYTAWQPNWNATEGYLWEEGAPVTYGGATLPGNATETTFNSTLTKTIQKQLRHIQPLLISNQKNPTQGTSYDPSIQIVTQSTNYSTNLNGTPENDLFKRDGAGSWTYYRIQPYPATTLISNWVSINSSGIIAGLGSTNNDGSSHALLMVPVELAVDANRDGNVVLLSEANLPTNQGLSLDTTTQQNPYRFWVNNDTTRSSFLSIDTATDLENFSRLWIDIGGLQDAIAAGTIQVGLQWGTVVSNSPSINIYPSADVAGSLSYLTNAAAATNQTSGTNNSAITGQAVGSGTFIIPTSYWSGLSASNHKKCFLFEGVAPGVGQLQIVFFDASGHQIGSGGSLWLNLMDIKQMYQRALVNGNQPPPYPYNYTSSQPPAVNMGYSIDNTDPAGGSGSFPFVPDPNEDKSNPTCIVFVHGFNMTYPQSDGYGQTLFKRFWQMGYKGRFASFRWPTYTGAIGTFNDCEYIAWYSGAALAQFVQSIGQNYTVDVIGHSLGNVVVGSALADNRMQINAYAMLHAAVSASCYSQTNSAYTVRSTASVPDTDSDFFTKSLGYTYHLGKINEQVTNEIVNFFDENDPVITAVWDANNAATKPNSLKGYGYYANPAVIAPDNIWKVILSSATNYRPVVFKYESMGYVDYSLTGTIGSNTGLAGSVSSQVSEDVFQESFINQLNAHSYEFLHALSDPNIFPFYENLMSQLGVKSIKF